jgi:hypothetical protein
MFRGEIYGYPHYLHTRVLLPKQVKFLWEDVICLYWPWAVSNTPEAYVDALDMVPALSVMHGKSHSWNCQVLFIIQYIIEIVLSKKIIVFKMFTDNWFEYFTYQFNSDSCFQK